MNPGEKLYVWIFCVKHISKNGCLNLLSTVQITKNPYVYKICKEIYLRI